MTKKSRQNGTKTCAPLSVRLASEERRLLVKRADGLPLSTYVRRKLFDGVQNADAEPEHRLSALERQKLLAQILANIGQQGLHKSLSDIAHAAQLGLLTMTPEVETELQAACKDISDIRKTLLKALGLRIGGSP